MNVSEMYAEEGRLLSDPNNERWSQSVLLFRNNQAQMIVQGYARARKESVSLTPVAGTAEVALGTAVMDILRAKITESDGTVQPLVGKTREQLDYNYPGWENWDADLPRFYWYNASSNEINLVPAPSSEYAISNGLTVWTVQPPDTLDDSADVPFDGVTNLLPYHYSIIHWVVSTCLMDDGTPEALGKAKFHKSGDFDKPGQFELQIKRMWALFDTPTDIPARFLWRPTGGRASGSGSGVTKSNPL
jgi:hypothetical protein